MSTLSQAETSLGAFLSQAGGFFHPALHPESDAYGTSIYTKEDLPPGTKAVCCPFSLAITPSSVRRALPLEFFPPPSTAADPSIATNTDADDDDHRLMVLYLVLHLLPSSLIASIRADLAAAAEQLHLAHEPYVSALPNPSSLRTPLYFTPRERALLRGTNLDGATSDRERQWQRERDEVLRRVRAPDEVKSAISWDHWLWACTMLSSRAFPSSLIDGDRANSTPVLFPGIDLLNHRPTAKVTWSTDVHAAPTTSDARTADKGSLTIVLDETVSAGSQVFNTYGAKSNEELLLGYGFVLPPPNPADILALKLSFPDPSSSPTFAQFHEVLARLGLREARHTVPPSGELPPALLAQMRLLLAANSSDPDAFSSLAEGILSAEDERGRDKVAFLGWENELDVLDALEGMLESKADALSAVDVDDDAATVAASGPDQGDIRPEVLDMIRIYREGQLRIVEAALAHREQLFEAAVARARAEGVELAFECDEDEAEDDLDEDASSE
ncbi:hypothetical protein JCM3774_000629 [Rhodotorula dairenensis]